MGVDLLIPRNRNDDAGARIGFKEIISVSLVASCRCYFLFSRRKPEIQPGNVAGSARKFFFHGRQFPPPPPKKKLLDFKGKFALTYETCAPRVVSSTRVTRINTIIDA